MWATKVKFLGMDLKMALAKLPIEGEAVYEACLLVELHGWGVGSR